MTKRTETANIIVTMDGKQAEKMLDVLKKKSAVLGEEIAELNKKRLDVGISGEEARRFDKLKSELLETRRVAREVTRQVKDVSTVIDHLDTSPIKAIRDAIKAVTAQMERLDRSTPRYAEKENQLRMLNQELTRIASSKAFEKLDLDNLVKKINVQPIDVLKRAVAQLNSEIGQLAPGTQAYIDKNRQLSLVRGRMDELTGSVRKQNSAFEQVGNTIKRLASYVLVYAGFNELTSGLRKIVEMNARLSDQLADIEKTTGITGKDLRALGEDIRQIDTRTPVEELNNLAYTAGKLGITGRENVLGFVKAANQINVALGEDLGEDAIRNIAKLNDVLGITRDMGVEKSLLATGSAINELGQSSTASEGYLVDFAQRLGGIAAQAGITVQQILALGSASDQAGQNVEVSATALNKLITTIISKTNQVAKAIGVTSEELKGALSESTWQGLMLVFEKLAGKGGLAGIAPLMGDLGSDGARLNAVISALTINMDKMRGALELSNKAFAEATSLTLETLKKEESLNGIWLRSMKNLQKYLMDSKITARLKDIAVYVYRITSNFDEMGNRISGAVNIIAVLADWLVRLATFLMKNIDLIASLVAAFVTYKAAILGAQIATKAYTAVLATWQAMAKTVHATMFALQAAGSLLAGNIGGATKAWKLFNTAFKSSVVGLALSALVGIGTAIYAIYQRTTAASRAMAAFRKELNESVSAAQSEAIYLFDSAMKAAAGTDERKRAIIEINEKYGKYLPNLLTEVTSTTELATALKVVNRALQDQIVMRMKKEEIERVTRQGLTDELNAIDKMKYRSKGAEDMQNRIVNRMRELTETYASEGASALRVFLNVRKGLQNAFPDSSKESGYYWDEVNRYVTAYVKMRDKLAEIDKRYEPYSPTRTESVDSIDEVVVTAAKKIKTAEETEKERQKRIKQALADVDAYIDREKTKLIQARIDRQKYREEEIDSSRKYEGMLEKIEFEGLEKKLAIAGLEKEKRAEIERRFYDLKLKLFNKAETAEKTWMESYSKLQDQLGIRSENKDLQAIARINVLYDTLIDKAREGVKANYKSQEEINADIEKFQAEREKAIREYWAGRDLKSLDEEESREKARLRERFTNREMNYEEYLYQEAEIEAQYAETRLLVEGLTEAQLTELRKKEQDTRFNNLKAAYDKEKALQKQYVSVIENSLTGLGAAFGELFGSTTDGMKNMQDALIDTLFDTLSAMVDIWLQELSIAGTVYTAQGQMAEIGKKGLMGLATGALISGIIHGLLQAAKSAIKSAIGGRSGSSSSSGERVVSSSGYSVGGDTGEGDKYEVAGIVHKGEYVVPQWQMKDSVSFDHVRALETIRRTRTTLNPLRGYAEGGGVSEPVPVLTPADMELSETLEGIRSLLERLERNGVNAVYNINRLNDIQDRLSNSRLRGSRK